MRVDPKDQPGDAAYNPTADPRMVPPGSSYTASCWEPPGFLAAASATKPAPGEKAKWAKEKAPEDPKAAAKFIDQVIEGHDYGEPFFHPGMGCNVVKSSSRGMAGTYSLNPIAGPLCDAAKWYQAGCVGPAPPLDEKQAEEYIFAREVFEGVKPTAKPAGKKE